MLSDIDFKIVYASGEDEPLEFFMESLLESKYFDLGLGYFSSSGILSLSLGFAYFINNGGKMRIIINDTLSIHDKEAIQKGLSSRPDELIEEQLVKDIEKLTQTLSKYDKHFFNCLSWMIATKKIEFIAITPLNSSIGIAHHKFGIFRDIKDNKVVFSGSANFSNRALFHNLESISCYNSWSGEKNENERLEYFYNLFNKLWDGNAKSVRKIPIEKVKVAIRSHFPIEDINELIDDEIELFEKHIHNKDLSEILKSKYLSLYTRLKNVKNTPFFPRGYSPRNYQTQACINWTASGCVGFFEMATGTGKTITALNCVLDIYKKEDHYKVLILVPTIHLAEQWEKDINKFGFENIIIANSKNSRWTEQTLRQLNKAIIGKNNFFIITTYATFNLPKFQGLINLLSEQTILIADEAHNLGTLRSQSNYPFKFTRRIGLSATPERQYDNEGTTTLLSFFNASEKPTFKLGMQEAIEKGFLCKYYYYPRIVKLTGEELDEYREISKKLSKYFNTTSGDFISNSIVTSLLLKRKRIIHKAQNKLTIFRECINEIFNIKHKIQFTLVYVPEGKASTMDEEDIILINEYANVLTKEFNIKQHQFIGETKNRSEILKRFSEGDIEVLTAMKCLDEGVDVQRTEIAIFCASTSNPRQFIQRRGRILRNHPEKKFAYIFDMIVIPNFDETNFDESLEMERAILKSEFKRVYEFAIMSENKWQALKELENVASLYKIDIFSTKIS